MDWKAKIEELIENGIHNSAIVATMPDDVAFAYCLLGTAKEFDEQFNEDEKFVRRMISFFLDHERDIDDGKLPCEIADKYIVGGYDRFRQLIDVRDRRDKKRLKEQKAERDKFHKEYREKHGDEWWLQ